MLAFMVALVGAITLHEIAHGLVAYWNGDSTAKLYGRLTLNPVKHFDLVGFLMMLFVGFGWAKPVPVDPSQFKNRKVGCVTVSLAGIVTNILLAFIFAIPFVLIADAQAEPDSARYYVLYTLLQISNFMVSLNISFALFNILPLYPLDGYRFISCFVNENKGFMTFLRRYSLYIMLGLIILDYIPYVSQYSPLNLFVGWIGTQIRNGFLAFWRLII